MFAVVTAGMPTYRADEEAIDMESMAVHLFDSEDEAIEWAVKHPDYICEVVPVTKVKEVAP